jgi:hypothetical protein
MAATEGVLSIDVYLAGGDAPATVADRFNVEAANPALEATRLSALFAAMSSGVRPGKVRVRTDSYTGVRASLTLAVTQANIAAGEYLDIIVPGRGTFRITAVASGADVTLGQFVSATNDATTATNMAAAVNGMLGLKDAVVASTNSGDLILTAKEYGTAGNSYVAKDGTTNGLTPAGGTFASGKDASSKVTSSVVCVSANTDADDTLKIGAVTLTAKAGDASGENQFNIGASNTAMGDNLAAAINAHSKLLGLCTAVAVTGTVTITWELPARIAEHVGQMTSSDADGIVITQPSLASVSITNTTATRTYALGGP